MYTVKIMNEFMHGAIWVYENGIPSYYELIDNDPILCKLNKETEVLYNSYYEFNSHDLPCYFNEELERKNKNKMQALINQIMNRLKEIDDGSFQIEDYETIHLNNI